MTIEWFSPGMTGKEADAVKAVLDSGYINDGPITAEFEKRVASLCGRQYGVAVPSGTTAIALSLIACGIGPGDDVIVPCFTYIATANAARLVGANVVLADIEPHNLCLSASTVEAARTAQTRAVICVEVNGRQPDYAQLIDCCDSMDAKLITDSCEALGSESCGYFGWASCFSFSPNKLVTTGQGGMIVTNSQYMHRRLLELKQQGMIRRGSGGADLHPALGFNFKFTDILAAIGLEQLKVLPDRLKRCRERDEWYAEGLAGIGDIVFPQRQGTHLWRDILIDHRMKLAQRLTADGIGFREFWLPLNRQRPYRYDKRFPVASSISARGLWLPSSYDITQEQVCKVIEVIRHEYQAAAA